MHYWKDYCDNKSIRDIVREQLHNESFAAHTVYKLVLAIEQKRDGSDSTHKTAYPCDAASFYMLREEAKKPDNFEHELVDKI